MSRQIRGKRGFVRASGLRCESLESRRLLAIVTVTNLSDSINGNTMSIGQLIASPGMDGISLREAIHAANNTANVGGADEIWFNIPGTAPHSIIPGTTLPTISDALVIDGTTEPDFLGVPIVELNGNAGAFTGLTINTTAGGSTIRGLVINRFGGNGIAITSGNNVVEGCYIGTDVSGLIDQGNSGVGISASGLQNRIGGTTAAARNVISGNNSLGVAISGAGSVVQGNYIGINSSGTAAVGNSSSGVFVTVGSVTVGGAVPGAGNVISGNGSHGIENLTGPFNTFQGNYIGTNASGTSAVPNLVNGIVLGTPGNLIGGSTPGAGNLISGNATHGLVMSGSSASNNSVQGNQIGTDATGTAAISNGGYGILLGGSPGTTIGGTTPDARNIISGNAIAGISVDADNTVIYGNYIGTDSSGTVALPNSTGVILLSGSNTTIGGTLAGAGNLISANAGAGVQAAVSTNARILGNLIGTDGTGTLSLGNGADGILCNSGSSGTIIGGSTPAARNIISGNGFASTIAAGVRFFGNTTVLGNYIGTDITGTLAVPNFGSGVMMLSPSATIGGNVAGAGNLISGNLGHGIVLGSSGSATVLRNLIGTQADGVSPLGNAIHGILMNGAATGNIVGNSLPANANTIAYNAGNGVMIALAAASGNQVINNSIFSNVGLGIDIANDGVTPNDAADIDGGPNGRQNFPVITHAAPGSVGQTLVAGTFNSTSGADFTLHFYRSSVVDASGYGEGRTPFASFPVTTDSNGNRAFVFEFPVALGVGEYVTMTATSPTFGTSEFSQSVAVSEMPSIAVDDVSVTEGNSGTVNAVFTVHRTGNVSAASSVYYTTVAGTAEAPGDYVHIPTTLLEFAAGETTKTITVLVKGDTTSEPNESFTVSLSNPFGATIGDATATGTILNDDADLSPPAVLTSVFNFVGFLPTPYEVQFNLNEPVTASPGGVPVLIRRADNNQLVATVMAGIQGGSVVLGQMTTPLADGNYRATLPAGAVIDFAGNPFAGDVDVNFFILGGDANRDRKVDVNDLVVLANNWLGSGKTFGQGDFNYDGVVNQIDLGILATRWQQNLAPPAVPLPAVSTSAKRAPVRTPTRVVDLVAG